MRQGIKITNTSAPTSWTLVQEIRRSFPGNRMVGQHSEGTDKKGVLHLALEDGGEISAAVCLFERIEASDGFWLEYRMIREEEGPMITSYPSRLLDMLSSPRNEAAEHWRSCCRAQSDTPALDYAPIRTDDYVFLPAPSIPLPRSVAPHAVLRCLSAKGGFVKAIEIDPSTGEDLGLEHLNLIAADLRRTAFPLPQNRRSLALDLRKFFEEPMPDLSEVDEIPDFDAYMSCVWDLDGEVWRPKRIEMMTAEEVEEQKAAIASGGLLLMFQSLHNPDQISVELMFGPSGEAVAVAIGGIADLAEQSGLGDHAVALLVDLERRMNMPVEPFGVSYLPFENEEGYDGEEAEMDEAAAHLTM